MNYILKYNVTKYLSNLKYRHICCENNTFITLPKKYLHENNKLILNNLSNVNYHHIIFSIKHRIKISPIINNISNHKICKIILCACKYNNVNVLRYIDKQINLAAFIINQYIDEECWKSLTNLKIIIYFQEELKIKYIGDITIFPSITTKIVKYFYSKKYKIEITDNIFRPIYTKIVIYLHKINEITLYEHYSGYHENVVLIKYFQMTNCWRSPLSASYVFNNFDIVKYLSQKLNNAKSQFFTFGYLIHNIDVIKFLYNLYNINFGSLKNNGYDSLRCKNHDTVMFIHKTFKTKITLDVYYSFFVHNNIESIKYWHNEFKHTVDVNRLLYYVFNKNNIEIVKWVYDNYTITILPDIQYLQNLSQYELLMIFNLPHKWLVDNIKYYKDIEIVKYLCKHDTINDNDVSRIISNALNTLYVSLPIIKYLVGKYKITKSQFLTPKLIKKFQCICSSHYDILKYLHKEIGFTQKDFIDYKLFAEQSISDLKIIKYVHEEIKFSIKDMKKIINYDVDEYEFTYGISTVRYLHEMFGIVKSDFISQSDILDKYYDNLC